MIKSGPGKYKNQHIKLPLLSEKAFIDPPFNVSDGTGTKQISHHSYRTFFTQQKQLVPLEDNELDSLLKLPDSIPILPTRSGVRTGMAGWFS